MHPSAICTRCNEGDESLCHALLECADARDVWLASLFVLNLMMPLGILLRIYSYGCMPTLQRMKCPLFVLLFEHVGWVEIRLSWRITTAIFYN